jgi:DNA-directed RNA polymerase specialized sigma24 family protein
MVDDVVDEVLARAYGKVDRHLESSEVANRLLTIATDVLTNEGSWSSRRKRMLSLEGPPPREPTDISIDETMFDFYQPDDLVKLENLVAAPSSDPEEVLSK